MTSAPNAEPGRDALIAALQDGVIDPDLGVNVVDLGFIRRAGIEDGTASIVMTLTSPACPLTKLIEDQARTAVVGTLARELKIEWTWSPPGRRPTSLPRDASSSTRSVSRSAARPGRHRDENCPRAQPDQVIRGVHVFHRSGHPLVHDEPAERPG